MTFDQLLAVREQAVPLTGRLCIALADALLDVINECEKMGPTEEQQGSGSSFVLGYKTKARVIAAQIAERELP